jgi:tetratricopeptide (TPR) repeat protein/DNA-binding winged helix-turn-helix (wHTH) protein/TolB-like protein
VRYRDPLHNPSQSRSRRDRLVYEFSAFRVDVTERILFRDRIRVALTSKAFDTLLALIRNSGQVVSKGDLMESVWPDTVVEENNLNQCISVVRKALGESPDGKSYIETVPRRGYRFAAQVTTTWIESSTADTSRTTNDNPLLENVGEPSHRKIETDSEGGANRPSKTVEEPNEYAKARWDAFHVLHGRWLVSVGCALLLIGLAVAVVLAGHFFRHGTQAPPAGVPALARGRYLAILPPRVLDDEASLEYVAEGLAGALSAGLMDSQGVHLASATAVDRLHQSAPLQSIARQLGANLLVVGTLQGSPEHMHIHLSLEDVADTRHVWSGDFSGATSDIFTLEDRIYSKLATALGVEPSDIGAELRSARSTESVQSYDLYLRGKDALRQRQQLKNVQAAVHFQEEALKIDPDFALAYAGLADACLEMYRQQRDNFWAEKALNAAQQAVRLNSNIAEVHFVLGSVYRVTGKLDDAVAEEKRGLELAPRSDEGYRRLGRTDRDADRSAEALQAYRKAVEINPYYWFNFSSLGGAYFQLGRYEEALAAFRKVTELEPDNAYGYDDVGAVYLAQGKWSEAIPEYQKAIGLEPHFIAYSNLGTAYFYLKRYDEAANMFERAVVMSPNQQVVLGNLADAYRWSGQSTKALATYDRAIALAYKELEVNPRNATAMQCLALYYAKKGQRTQALEFIRRARALDSNNVRFMYNEAEVEALVGKPGLALDALREAFRKGYPVSEAAVDPELESLRSHPEFKQLMASADNNKT